ncbi:MAG: sulfurtransferase-like selenium metabolism protein YedF [Firmicutes bacterium]|nr:sulfurtransferase-like selenium metabolism protein YedF [Bacillota bacterium]
MSGIKKVDCRNLACPQPVINTKKVLDSMDEGTVTVIVDNDTAKENIMIFAKNAGYRSDVEKKGEDHQITITKGNTGILKKEQDSYRAEKGRSIIYLITSNLLGQGPPDLGAVLMKSLMVTLTEMNPPPEALLFLNSGVMMTCEGSPVLEQLQTLFSRGATLISCGTCLDYYKLKDKLKVGRVGNMLEINGYLSGESKAITIA